MTTTAPEDRRALPDLAAAYRELPVMPRTVAKVLRQLSSPDWTIEEVEATIARDPALMARMIAVSNSALYGGGHEFRTLHQALVRLGFRAIRSLAVVAAARAMFPTEDERFAARGQELYDHAAACGAAARVVAEALGEKDPDDAFAAGMLHDLGKVVVLLNRPDDFERIVTDRRRQLPDDRAIEQEILDVDHTELGAHLMAGWLLPASIVDAAVSHHDPDEAGTHERTARIVACGDLLAHLHQDGGDAARLRGALLAELARLGLDTAAAEELVLDVRVRLASLIDLL